MSKKAPALHIGATADSQTAKEVQATMKLVLDSTAGDAVKIAALEVIKARYSVSNVQVSGCSFMST